MLPDGDLDLPVRISAMGGHCAFDDDQNTPNDLMAVFEFPNPNGIGDKKKMLQFEVRHWYSNNEVTLGNNTSDSSGYMKSSKNNVGNLFYGTKGYMMKNVDEWRTFMGTDGDPGPSGSGLANNYENFTDSIRANDPSMLNAKIKDGVHSCMVMHMGNISYQLGRTLEFDPSTMKFKKDKEANAMISRPEYRHPFVIPKKV